MKFVVRHVPRKERKKCIEQLKSQIPELVVVEDTGGRPMETFADALRHGENEPIVMLEDDIELTNRFCEKIECAVSERPHEIINFFNVGNKSNRKKYRAGKHFNWMQCVYLPRGYGGMIAEFCENTWVSFYNELNNGAHPHSIRCNANTLFDAAIAEWLAGRDEKYFIWHPALVQHLAIESAIEPGRVPIEWRSSSFVKD